MSQLRSEIFELNLIRIIVNFTARGKKLRQFFQKCNKRGRKKITIVKKKKKLLVSWNRKKKSR